MNSKGGGLVGRVPLWGHMAKSPEAYAFFSAKIISDTLIEYVFH